MTDRRAAVADFDIADRQLAGLNAVQKVLMVVRADVELVVGLFERLLDEIFGVALDLAAIDKDRAFAADKRYADRTILLALADNQNHSICVGVRDTTALRDLVVPLW